MADLPRSFWTPKRLLIAAFLLWPITTFCVDFMGQLYLDRLTARNDFGLSSSSVVMPLAFAGGIALIIAGLRRSNLDRNARILCGIFFVLLYLPVFLIWTLLAFPFGRINPNF